jgi:UDP-glucose 4-epimerase
MHFAAFAYVGESVTDPQKYYTNNVKNTINLLNSVLENNVRYFIFSSTCATYGMPQKLPLDENHRRDPINPYGKSKYMIEEILADYHTAYDFEFISLRYFNAAGADPEGEIGENHDPETHLIPLILDVARGRSEVIRVFGTDYETADGSCIRDYIHVSDLADAHILALEKLMDGCSSDFINLGTGTGFSVLQSIETASRVTGTEIPHIATDRRPGDPAVLIASNEKARRLLGWKPRYSQLDEIIQTAWNWHKKQ